MHVHAIAYRVTAAKTSAATIRRASCESSAWTPMRSYRCTTVLSTTYRFLEPAGPLHAGQVLFAIPFIFSTQCNTPLCSCACCQGRRTIASACNSTIGALNVAHAFVRVHAVMPADGSRAQSRSGNNSIFCLPYPKTEPYVPESDLQQLEFDELDVSYQQHIHGRARNLREPLHPCCSTHTHTHML